MGGHDLLKIAALKGWAGVAINSTSPTLKPSPVVKPNSRGFCNHNASAQSCQ